MTGTGRTDDRHGVVEGGPIPEVDAFTLLECSPSSPRRTLHWRWDVATFLARTGSRTRQPWVDGTVRRAARHLRREEGPRPRGGPKRGGFDPTIAQAMSLWSGVATATRTAVEAMLLAGLDDRAIAARVGRPPEVVAAYHDCFFDIRPVLGHSDVVLARAFGPAFYDTTAPDVGLLVRWLAFLGGPVAALALVDAVVLPGDAAETDDDRRELAGQVEELRLAWSLPAEGGPVSDLLDLHARIEQLASERAGRTIAGVTGPVAIGPLDVGSRVGSANPVRADGPTGAPACTVVRAEGAPGVGPDGPDGPGQAGRPGLPPGGLRLGIAG